MSDAITIIRTLAIALLLSTGAAAMECKDFKFDECTDEIECDWVRKTNWKKAFCRKAICRSKKKNRCKKIPWCMFTGKRCKRKIKKSKPPTETASNMPTPAKSATPTKTKTASNVPTLKKSSSPTETASNVPTLKKSSSPTETASDAPTVMKSSSPTETASDAPTVSKSSAPTETSSNIPTTTPTDALAVNVALSSLGGRASQSSNAHGHAANANDGNTDGNWSNGSVTHTHHAGTSWWRVELPKKYVISNIKVYNRTDCCQQRIKDFLVYIYNEGAVVYNSKLSAPSESSTAKSIYEFSIPNIVGDKVQIAVSDAVLSLAEVVVMGK
jgi:hypothetical protein